MTFFKGFCNKNNSIAYYLMNNTFRSPENFHNETEKPYRLKLASGDKIGNIIIWNVLEATIIVTLQGTYFKKINSSFRNHWNNSTK